MYSFSNRKHLYEQNIKRISAKMRKFCAVLIIQEQKTARQLTYRYTSACNGGCVLSEPRTFGMSRTGDFEPKWVNHPGWGSQTWSTYSDNCAYWIYLHLWLIWLPDFRVHVQFSQVCLHFTISCVDGLQSALDFRHLKLIQLFSVS